MKAEGRSSVLHPSAFFILGFQPEPSSALRLRLGRQATGAESPDFVASRRTKDHSRAKEPRPGNSGAPTRERTCTHRRSQSQNTADVWSPHAGYRTSNAGGRVSHVVA